MHDADGDVGLLEELRVTEEELRLQNEELVESQFLIAQERERYRALFHHAPVPYIVTDGEGAIHQAQSHLVSLLDDLHTISRAGAGHLSFDLAPCALEPLLQRVLALLEPQAAERDIRLSTSGALDPVVHADGDRTLQILLNLVTNAIKFTPQSGLVEIGCESDPEWVHITVSDSGSGVPPDSRERIFEPYVQLGGTMPARVSGSGLGLAISRQLARCMAGDLTCVESATGGSVFVLRLPRSTRIAERD